MTVLVGSRHEGYGETGMAHLLEHMVFKGTPKHPNVPKALQEHGAQFQRQHLGGPHRTTSRRSPPSDENLEFAIAPGSRPPGQQLHQEARTSLRK